jgi:hypothetical protein
MLVTVNDLVTYMDITFSLRQRDAAEFVLEGLQSELEAYLGRPIEVQEFTEQYVLPYDHVGMPTSSFFYNTSLDTTMNPLTYSQPSPTIYIRNSPITKVNYVKIINTSTPGLYMSEAIDRRATVTGAVKSGTNVTYTAAGHGFTRGQHVTVTGMTPSGYNIVDREITSVTTTTFVVGGFTDAIAAFSSGGTAEAFGYDYTVRRYGIDVYRGFANDVFEISYNAGLDGANIPVFKLMILRAATREMQNMHDDVVGIKDLEPRNVAPMETGFSDRELAALKSYRRVRVS